MRKAALFIGLVFLSVFLVSCATAAPEEDPKIDYKAERSAMWDEYVRSVKEAGVMERELEANSLEFGEVSMRLGIFVIGEKPEGGYPLYIALHGGG